MNAITDIADTGIVGVRADWIRLPLRRPYVVTYDAIEHFDIFLTSMRFADGTVAYGEACPVPGYSSDTAQSLWKGIRTLLPSLRDTERGAFVDRVAHYLADQPFLVAALITPLEWPRVTRTLQADAEVPLIGTILGDTPDAMERDVHELLTAGYRTLKMKVGWDVDKDLRKVATVQEAVRATGIRPFLRIDANQGYSLEQARAFLSALDPEFVQLFEQPVGDDWNAIARLSHPDVPIMLDESIVDLDAIRRAAELPGVGFVKFKLMKSGSFAHLYEEIALARELGLNVVLGNGVAGDIGCLGEAIVSAQLGLEHAGEMNGFLKPWQRVASNMTVRDGSLVITSIDVSVDEAVIGESLVDQVIG